MNLLQRKVTALEERVTMATERETEMQSTMNKVRERGGEREREREEEEERRRKRKTIIYYYFIVTGPEDDQSI